MKRNFVQSTLFSRLSWGALVLAATSQAPAQAYSFSWVWGDNFDSLSSSKWNVYTGPFGSSSNSYFMPSNAWTWDGKLNLVINQAANNGGRKYTAGGVDTGWRWSQTYGKWEVRARFPAGYGVTGYIGLFAQDGSWPPEVDFAEVLGREYWSCHMTQHYDSDNKTIGTNIWNSDVGGVNFDQWHTYILEWTPGTLKYYVDNKLFLTQPQKFTAKDMKLAIGTGTGNAGSWVRSPDEASSSGWGWPLPASMQVDWVNIYKYNP